MSFAAAPRTTLTKKNTAITKETMFLSSEVTEKRAFLNFLLQNPVLSGRKLLFKLKSPFDVIVQCSKTKDWLPWQDDVRTFFKNTTDDIRIPAYSVPI